MDEIIGVVYPLAKDSIDFMFTNKRDIFVKYTGKDLTKKAKMKINTGMKLYLYESGGDKRIVGEAKIIGTHFLDAHQILDKYANRLAVPLQDFKTYSYGRESKNALVLELDELKKYEDPIKLSKSITMAGMYITKARKKELFDKT